MPTLGEIVEAVEGAFEGDRTVEIGGVRALAEAGPGELSFLANPRYLPMLETTAAAAILVGPGVEGDSARLIRVRDPYFALAAVLQRWFAAVPGPKGISPDARIASTAKIGSGVSIGAFAVVGENADIGDNVIIHENVVIGAGVSIGAETVLYANTTVYHGCRIGRRCIIHSGVVIGADGYGFATHDGRHHKLPQIGIVRIEDDVEIGANTTVDRAALGETVIGEGTKIDDLVMIAHNVKIGRHCLIVAQSGIAGSTEIGDGSVLGGQAGVSGHLRLGPGVRVGAQAAVMKDWPGAVTLSGSPARPLRHFLRSQALVERLPELLERISRLEKDK
jgi:UDP-3-O-[3-hydroxymyristoyl] glucosamine N-acyltransferase